MTWADFILNLSKLLNGCFSSEEERLIWLRKNNWDVGVNDGTVWCRHVSCPDDVMTPTGAVAYQAGLILDALVDAHEIPLKEEMGIQKGLLF